MFYTSRSAIEASFTCPRKRWLGYLYGGKGITQVQANVPLTTGTAVHEGVGFLLRNVMNGCIPSVEQHYLAYESGWVDGACKIALQKYKEEIEQAGISTQDQNSQFVLAQEMARTEALVRAWSIAELPQVVRYFNVYSVEDEIVVPLTPDIMFQARVDAILQEKETGKMFNYSLKTMKDYREKVNRKGNYNTLNTDRKFAIALQTQTEAWAAEQLLKQRGKTIGAFLSLAGSKITEEKKFANLTQFVGKYLSSPEEKIYGTKHCFLIKGGKAEEGDYGEYVAGDSPLIRGYKNSGGEYNDTSKNYCHSYYYPNPANKSGKGVIGKAWQSFNVWEEMTVKEWIGVLNSKVQDHTGQMIPEVQPECGDIIKAQVVTPEETFVQREQIESTLVQITKSETKIMENARFLEQWKHQVGIFGGLLDEVFPMNRAACLQMGVCEFYPICHLKDWKDEAVSRQVREDPVGSGLFRWRVPHHRAELEIVNGK